MGSITQLARKNSLKRKAGQGGFTLIEMAIVLVIIGIIVAAFFSFATMYVKKKRYEDMQTRMQDLRVAFANYIHDDIPDPSDPDPPPPDAIRFPCPAPLTLGPDDAGFGEEVCPSGTPAVGTDLGGVFVAQSPSGALVLIGAVPTATLGVSGELMQDIYGNKMTYAVTNSLTATDALAGGSSPSGQIRIVDQKGNVVNNAAAFYVVSHGEDGAGAYTLQGERYGEPCRTTVPPGEGDSQNCLWQTNNEAVFRESAAIGFSTAVNDQRYDDFTIFDLDDREGWWQATDESGTNIVNRNIGNVGIGVSGEPQQKLDVSGNVTISGDTGLGITTARAKLDVVGNTIVSGNLGVGTDSPQMKLDIAGDGTISGNLGVGTVSPATKLDVTGAVKVGSVSTPCASDKVGAIRYYAADDIMQYCSSTGEWRNFSTPSDCSTEVGLSSEFVSRASCPADKYLVSGGGRCTVPSDPSRIGFMHENRPEGNSWVVDCWTPTDKIRDVGELSGKAVEPANNVATAYAVCCKRTTPP